MEGSDRIRRQAPAADPTKACSRQRPFRKPAPLRGRRCDDVASSAGADRLHRVRAVMTRPTSPSCDVAARETGSSLRNRSQHRTGRRSRDSGQGLSVSDTTAPRIVRLSISAEPVSSRRGHEFIDAGPISMCTSPLYIS